METSFKGLNGRNESNTAMVDTQSNPQVADFSDDDDVWNESGDENMDEGSRKRAIQERKKADEHAQKQMLTKGAEGMLQQRNLPSEVPDRIRKQQGQL